MQAWTLIAHGKAQKAFELRTHPMPVPAPGQVLIACEGFGLNYADVMAVRGLYRDAPPLPSILGYEVVGRVEQVSQGVSPDLLGKRVVAMTRFGGYAEYAVTDHRACAVVPETLPMGEAAALATQGCTAWYAARMLCPLHTGQRVLVHSAAGGVGQFLVQLALYHGCEVYALASGSKLAHLRKLGVQHAIDRTRTDAMAQLRRALGSNRLDVSFNAVGGSTFKDDMALLGSGGRLVLYGGAQRGASGAFGTLRFVWRMGLVLPIFLMMKSRSILGINMLRISEDLPDVLGECLKGVVRAHADGVLRPTVHAVFDRTQLVQAHEILASGSSIGKVAVAW